MRRELDEPSDLRTCSVRIGVAGWAIPRQHVERFPTEGSHLERYAGRYSCVEINSSFYRPHRRATYERWAATVPESFRFAVKTPKTLTHEQRLQGNDDLLRRFLDEIAGLGRKLGPILVQLPPSLAFEPTIAARFFERLRARFAGFVACEPRHPSWFAKEGEALLTELSIARVAADPVLSEGAGEPGGWPRLVYVRLHGSPRTYYSEYEPDRLSAWTERVLSAAPGADETWCVFDNTALGAAQSNALSMIETLRGMSLAA